MIRIDIRNSITSLAILQISAMMQKLSPGEGLEILCEEESFLKELQRVHHDYAYGRFSCVMNGDGNERLFVVRKIK
jgi:TusA-related sulfurtransferase